MKKIIAPFMIVAFLAAMVSCKKDYTCTCKYKIFTLDTTVTYDLGKTKKKDAKDACEKNATQINAYAGAGAADCSI